MQGIAKVRNKEHRGYLELPKTSDYTNYENLEDINYVYITNIYTMLYVFFWVITRRLNFICRRFGTLCSNFIGR